MKGASEWPKNFKDVFSRFPFRQQNALKIATIEDMKTSDPAQRLMSLTSAPSISSLDFLLRDLTLNRKKGIRWRAKYMG